MFTGYAYYAGGELWNNERTMAYLAGAPELGVSGLKLPSMSLSANCGCPTIIPYVCDPGPLPDGGYVSPAIDPAPWYDPTVPDSVDFAGLFVESITPFESVVSRELAAGAILGGSLGPLRLGPRTVTVTGWLLARTCCAAEYGLRWLNEALAQTQGCDGCSLGDLGMLRCCPPGDDECRLASSATSPGCPDESWTLTAAEGPAGVFTITIDDPNQANVLSDPLGLVNNDDGALEECWAAGGIARIMARAAAGSAGYFLLFDPAAMTLGAGAPSGNGWQRSLTLDTTVAVSCPDEREALAVTRAALQRFILASGGTEAMLTVGDIECLNVETGGEVEDICRVLHRVGLIEGPSVTDRHGTCCNTCGCTSLRVQFTLASESPFIFSDVDWCVDAEPFPPDEYCIDWESICEECDETIGVQLVESEVGRPECGVTLRHDLTWCAEGWDPDDSCPPVDCLVTITGTTEFEGCETDTLEVNQPTIPCEIALGFFGDWTAVNFDLEPGSFPDECNGFLLTPNDCQTVLDPPAEDCVGGTAANCLFEVSLSPFSGILTVSGTATPVGWDPAVDGFPPAPCELATVQLPGGCPETPEWTAEPCAATPWNVLTVYTGGEIVERGGQCYEAIAGSTGVVPPNGAFWLAIFSYNPGDYVEYENRFWRCIAANDTALPTNPAFWEEVFKAPIKLTWDRCDNSLTWENIGPGAPYAFETVCFEIVEYCTVNEPEERLVRIFYSELTGQQSWEAIGWTGTLLDACKCYRVGEVVVDRAPPAEADCDPSTECPVNIICGNAYRPNIATTRQSLAAFYYRQNGSPPFVPPATPTFSDVPVGADFYLEIEWVADQGILNGFGDGTFRPDDPVSRQAFASSLYANAGSPPFVPPGIPSFTDVPLTHPFYLQIEWSANQGLMLGFGDGTWRPTNVVLRRIAALIFYRQAGEPPFSPPAVPTFNDVPIDDAQYIEIEWLYDEGITTGFGTALTWEPIGWVFDSCDPFPTPGCIYSVATLNGGVQETGPLIELIEIPGNLFVPDCGPPPIIPPPPSFVSETCYCEPIVTKRICCTFENPHQWNDATSVIQVYAGSGNLRNLRIAAYLNPFFDQGQLCACDPMDEFWRCRQPCTSIEIPQLPPGALITIDSRIRSATVRFANGLSANGLRYIESSGSTVFDWFDIANCSVLCMVATVDAGIADDATISLGMVGRFLSSGG